MQYRPLSNTGLLVSEICLGAMTFGAGQGRWQAIGKLDRKDVEAMVGRALDAGVNFIDTADVYTEGQSEELVGAALAALKRPREQVVIATKCRGRTGPGVNQVGLSRSHILASIDASLRRLKLEHVDLYQIHGVDRLTPLEETVHALDDVVRTGKVRYVGFCNLPAWMAMQALGMARAAGLSRFVSAQMYYSLVGRDIEREIVPLARDQHLAILPWSPLAGGLLSGKFKADKSGPSDARRAQFDFPPVDTERFGRVLQALQEVAAATNLSVARLALAWVLRQPFVTSVIIGAKTLAQLDDNLGASGVVIDPEHVAKLDAASALPAEYPGWMVEFQNSDPRQAGASRA